MDAFAIIGMIVSGLVGLFVLVVLWFIAGNVYGGIKGAYRLHAVKFRHTQRRPKHWQIIRVGLRAWTGERYRDGFGTYWQVGGLKVPVDGRDKIERDRFWGA